MKNNLSFELNSEKENSKSTFIIMKTLILLLISTATYGQIKPVAAIALGMTGWGMQGVAEVGVAQLFHERITLLGTYQVNYTGYQTAGIKVNYAHWIDVQKESYVAPVMGIQQLSLYNKNDELEKRIKPVFGIRYQVYGGFGEITASKYFWCFNVGFMFGNRKNQ
jgi:hypothetical protein